MASWREIDRIRKDAAGFRALAKSLLAAHGGELTEWETAFLESIVLNKFIEEYSSLQGEKLLEVRDDAQTIDKIRGFSVKILISGCSKPAWTFPRTTKNGSSRCARDPISIKRRNAGRLMRCARQLYLIQDHLVSA